MIYLWLSMLQATCPTLTVVKHPAVQPKKLNEISGIALSHKHIWVHNDSGDEARIFKLSSNGTLLQTKSFPGLKAIDWEDMTINHQNDQLFIADTGDNRERRKELFIHSYELKSEKLSSFPITLPNGSRDIEGIAFDPLSDNLFLLSKGRKGTVYLYKLDLNNPSPTIVHHYPISAQEGLNPERITAMDISPDGSWIATRNYMEIFLYKRGSTQTVATAMKEPPCIFASPAQKQGESIAFSTDGKSLYTISEGEHAPIYELRLMQP